MKEITSENNKEYKDVFGKLTRRELQITKLIVTGLTNKEIASELNISFNTVRTHHRNILQKTHQKCISSLVMLAIKNNLI